MPHVGVGQRVKGTERRSRALSQTSSVRATASVTGVSSPRTSLPSRGLARAALRTRESQHVRTEFRSCVGRQFTAQCITFGKGHVRCTHK